MKIICFGDSNTYGYDPASFFGCRYPEQSRWTDILAQKLNCKIINVGENGREIPTRQTELLQFEQLMLKQKPIDLIAIMLGSNDLLQGNDVQTIVKRMELFIHHIVYDRRKILLIGPPTMRLGEWVTSRNLIERSKKLNQEYRSLAQYIGINFANADEWDVSLSFDGVHFTEDGHVAFARGICNYIYEKFIKENNYA